MYPFENAVEVDIAVFIIGDVDPYAVEPMVFQVMRLGSKVIGRNHDESNDTTFLGEITDDENFTLRLLGGQAGEIVCQGRKHMSIFVTGTWRTAEGKGVFFLGNIEDEELKPELNDWLGNVAVPVRLGMAVETCYDSKSKPLRSRTSAFQIFWVDDTGSSIGKPEKMVLVQLEKVAAGFLTFRGKVGKIVNQPLLEDGARLNVESPDGSSPLSLSVEKVEKEALYGTWSRLDNSGFFFATRGSEEKAIRRAQRWYDSILRFRIDKNRTTTRRRSVWKIPLGAFLIIGWLVYVASWLAGPDFKNKGIHFLFVISLTFTTIASCGKLILDGVSELFTGRKRNT